jgi:CBS domain-containing protein
MADEARTGGGPVTFETGTVADAMTWGVLACTRDMPLAVVARMMSSHRVHAIVVLGTPDRADELRPLWGVITDLDLMAAAAEGRFVQKTVVDATRPTTASVGPDDSLGRAAGLMVKERTSHLVVVDPGSQSPVGVLSALDLAAVLSA